MKNIFHQFQAKFPRLEQNKILAPFTTMQIGGPADLFYELTDLNELPLLITEAKKLNLPYFILGGGSNTIFADKGSRGLVIHMKAKNIRVEDEEVIADAGALLSQVVQASLKNNLSGMEKMMGLPGTIGGAVRGNAGAFGLETKEIVARADIFNEEKGFQTVDNSYFQFGYRESVVKHNKKDIVLRVYLRLKKDSTAKANALNETLEILKSRAGTQPTGKCSGSFFKNPDPKKTAGYYLDLAGCKGLQVGQAKVSDKHANWIMNLGSATQEDVLGLCALMQAKVKAKFDISLEREVQMVGEMGFL
jgi:UDP-N-acetylmuramate dehydrogenase